MVLLSVAATILIAGASIALALPPPAPLFAPTSPCAGAPATRALLLPAPVNRTHNSAITTHAVNAVHLLLYCNYSG